MCLLRSDLYSAKVCLFWPPVCINRHVHIYTCAFMQTHIRFLIRVDYTIVCYLGKRDVC